MFKDLQRSICPHASLVLSYAERSLVDVIDTLYNKIMRTVHNKLKFNTQRIISLYIYLNIYF
jgi:hypothetical protein